MSMRSDEPEGLRPKTRVRLTPPDVMEPMVLPPGPREVRESREVTDKRIEKAALELQWQLCERCHGTGHETCPVSPSGDGGSLLAKALRPPPKSNCIVAFAGLQGNRDHC
eukprot:scaffold834_cov244-Pinguiococcus_pyrenoidosus.AAC.11